MAKRYFRNILQKFQGSLDHPCFSLLKHWLKNENLWHINKHSVSGALFVGFFCAMIPFPVQMPVAAVFSILLRTNFVISVVSTWISNPVTYVPLYTGCYVVGLWLLDLPMPKVNEGIQLDRLLENLADVWKPLLLGCLVSGFAAGSLGYMAVRIYWRFIVIRGWRLRRERRKKPRD